MKMKMKTRKELMTITGHCAICGDPGWVGKISHMKDCVLRDPGVTHVQVRGCRARVVICGPRDSDGKYWWRSGQSGFVYDIERRGRGRYTYYVMHKHNTGELVWDNARLRDIRKHIVDNQGVL